MYNYVYDGKSKSILLPVEVHTIPMYTIDIHLFPVLRACFS